MGSNACGATLLEQVRKQEVDQVLRLRVGHSKVRSVAFVPGVTQPIPGLRVRRMSSHLEVKDGQTFAMPGLLQDIEHINRGNEHE